MRHSVSCLPNICSIMVSCKPSRRYRSLDIVVPVLPFGTSPSERGIVPHCFLRVCRKASASPPERGGGGLGALGSKYMRSMIAEISFTWFSPTTLGRASGVAGQNLRESIGRNIMRRILKKTPIFARKVPFSPLHHQNPPPISSVFGSKNPDLPIRKVVVPRSFLSQSEGKNIT